MSSTSPLGSDFGKQIIDIMFRAMDAGTKQAYHMLWDILLTFLGMHWILVLLTLFVLFTAATLKAMMGRWGALGSLLYNLFYFGTLFIVGLIWGPEVFAGDTVRAACTVILYPICFYITGRVLEKTGLRRRF